MEMNYLPNNLDKEFEYWYANISQVEFFDIPEDVWEELGQ